MNFITLSFTVNCGRKSFFESNTQLGGYAIMGAAIEQKKQIVSEIKENFKNASSVVFVDYRGITVTEDTALRRKCTDSEVVYKVYKNNLIVRALNELGVTDFDPKMFEGTTSVAHRAKLAPIYLSSTFCMWYRIRVEP